MLGVADVLLEEVGRHDLMIVDTVGLVLDPECQRTVLRCQVVLLLVRGVASSRTTHIAFVAAHSSVRVVCGTVEAHRVKVTCLVGHLSCRLATSHALALLLPLIWNRRLFRRALEHREGSLAIA